MMGFKLSVSKALARTSLVAILVLNSVKGQTPGNITLDDNDPRISYQPTAWNTSASTSLNYGGSHMLAENPAAWAELNFTGTAVYFMSPLWPYLVNTALALDGGPVTLVDLQDHAGKDDGTGMETVASAVVWSRTNLANTQHMLVISVGAGQPYAIVDGIILTELPTNSASSISSAPSKSPTPSPSQSATNADVVGANKEMTSGAIAGIVVGAIFGLIALVVLALILLRRRQRKSKESEKLHRSNIPSFYDDPTPNSAYGGSMGSNPARGGTLYDPAGWTSQDSPTVPAFDSSTTYPATYGASQPLAGAHYDRSGYQHSTITSNSYAPVPTSQAGSDQLSYADGPSLRGIGSQDTLNSVQGPHIPGGYVSGVPISPEMRAPNRFHPPQSAYAATLSTLSSLTQKTTSSGTTSPPPLPRKTGPTSSPAARLYASGLSQPSQNMSGSTQDVSAGPSQSPPRSNEKKGGFRTMNDFEEGPPSYQG